MIIFEEQNWNIDVQVFSFKMNRFIFIQSSLKESIIKELNQIGHQEGILLGKMKEVQLQEVIRTVFIEEGF